LKSVPLRCPYCGNEVSFCLYVSTVRAERWRQVTAQQFERESDNSTDLYVTTATLLVCAACATPICQAPSDVADQALEAAKKRC
jgi:hypothetical protein